MKLSICRAGVIRKVAWNTGADGTTGSVDVPSEGSASQTALCRGALLAKSMAEFPQVP